MKADEQTETALLELLERFCSRFAVADADGVMQLFAPDADIAIVTSGGPLLHGPTELSAFLHRYAEGKARYSWTWNRHEVSAAGTVSWLLAEGTETAATEDGEEHHPYRMSLVCEKRAGRWLLVHGHGSSPQS